MFYVHELLPKVVEKNLFDSLGRVYMEREKTIAIGFILILFPGLSPLPHISCKYSIGSC